MKIQFLLSANELKSVYCAQKLSHDYIMGTSFFICAKSIPFFHFSARKPHH